MPGPSPRLEDLAASALDDDDTQTNVEPLPGGEEIPTVETRVDSAQMLALLAQAGLPSPFEGTGEDGEPLDGDTVADAGSADHDVYDDETAPTIPAPPKAPRSK